ncbi:hypothetical protein NN3_15360 [Nocardia neocaledoniensis NBRC 108232]|uniref:Uncharacterized protein DUF3263 n=1 Tax=Nocardia neocaledoniensis TaxID=236511 RepID=A0A317NIU9_9NOCA|nr:DUF3263 domain-containing protein [Nocardia neocaledoniensis]PWV75035.1 uncharacterized protein DUF3263 [Nocardia neocaledoniensis]GEM30529.1 hypothetical protein NN3_15360 [Nocardia neocaledoniensis NBRC 108232]
MTRSDAYARARPTAETGSWTVGPADIAVLEFAAVWAPYGGNDAEAFVQFGLTPEEFHRRLIRLLGTPAARMLTNTTVATLRRQCLERLSRLADGQATGRIRAVEHRSRL